MTERLSESGILSSMEGDLHILTKNRSKSCCEHLQLGAPGRGDPDKDDFKLVVGDPEKADGQDLATPTGAWKSSKHILGAGLPTCNQIRYSLGSHLH